MDIATCSLGRLRAFFAVFEAGGFTAAARRLRIGKSALSQQVARLEQELGVALFTRTTRAVVATDAGRQLHEACQPLLRELQCILEGIADAGVSGSLRITAPADYADLALCPALAEFSRRHPRVHVELVTDSRILSLIDERIDVAVRLGWPRDSSLRALKLGEFELHVVVAPAYVARFGMPLRPSDLVNCNWVAQSTLPQPLSWRFKGPGDEYCGVRVRSSLSANTVQGVLALVRSGGGISLAPDFSVVEDIRRGALVRALSDWHLQRAGIYLTWPSGAPEPANLRALIDFLGAWFNRSSASENVESRSLPTVQPLRTAIEDGPALLVEQKGT